jgi:hypothetical protein
MRAEEGIAEQVSPPAPESATKERILTGKDRKDKRIYMLPPREVLRSYILGALVILPAIIVLFVRFGEIRESLVPEHRSVLRAGCAEGRKLGRLRGIGRY